MNTNTIPVIDVSSLSLPTSAEARLTAVRLYDAFTSWGVFYCVNHGVQESVQDGLVKCAKDFFSLPLEEKMQISVLKGGLKWRGYVPFGAEGTHGNQDNKEGLYLSFDHSPEHFGGAPLHGENQYPSQVPKMKEFLLQYLHQVRDLGQRIMDGLSLSLGLDHNYLRANFTEVPEPIVLFRMWSYPPSGERGIGEHSDYGFITILKQEAPGLFFQHPTTKQWVHVAPVPNSFVVNCGDMLDRISDGRFKSAYHYVQNSDPTKNRLSFPFFFDPSWNSSIRMLPLPPFTEDPEKDIRWSKTSFLSATGKWYQYLAKKVQRIFPELQTSEFANFEGVKNPSSRFVLAISNNQEKGREDTREKQDTN